MAINQGVAYASESRRGSMTSANPGGNVLANRSEWRWWMQKGKKKRVDIVVGRRPARMVSARAFGCQGRRLPIPGCLGPFPQLPDSLIPLICQSALPCTSPRHSHSRTVNQSAQWTAARLFLRLLLCPLAHLDGQSNPSNAL